jgi:hypothetical protein
MDVVRSESTTFVFTKMGKFLVLGFIDVSFPRQWVGTKIGARSGVAGSRAYTVPIQFRDYLIEKAERYATLVASISPTQREKMDKTMWKDLNRVARSGSFEAMKNDVERSGKAAFEVHRPPKRPSP